MLEVEALRRRSLKVAARLRMPVAPHLPLLDADLRLRPESETVDRSLCVHAAAACAHGFSREKALRWLEEEGLREALSEGEARFLTRGVGEPSAFMLTVEGLWALAWALQKVDRLDFSRACADDFVYMLPDLKRSESGEAFRRSAHQRTLEEIAAAADLAYCLHWAVRESALDGRGLPGRIRDPVVVVERRRALEWLVGAEEWDAVSLDT